ANTGMDRAQADYIGMLATAMNALSLQESLERVGVPSRVQSAIEMQQIAEPYIRRRAIRHLEKHRVVIFACGTGSPHVTTDTAVAFRACDMNAECLLKATKVDGIYDTDPFQFHDAVKFEHLSYMDALQKRIEVMDAASFSLCMENGIPIAVLNVLVEGNLRAFLIEGRNIGTIVSK
ncbi:MAG: uridine monophosphate kinase, partial [Pyramidobacter sp.]|nr:uridine monophosphate kinase [Pyramidobacter sp.]